MTKSNLVGVMQGRLLPKYQGRYQAHPVGCWHEEFPVAQRLGLDCIEFILDFNDAEANPLLRRGGADEIAKVVDETGVVVRTICADYFMEAPLHARDSAVAEASMSVFKRLLSTSKQLGVSDIVLPCVDQSSLNGEENAARLIAALRSVLGDLEASGINVSLETDLAPQPFAELLGALNSPRVTVNYDIGNSASLGFDPVEELSAYGARISDIHIKDRVRGGGSVVLGQGNADFDRFFRTLQKFNYKGPFIMQAYRDDEGVKIFEQQLKWVLPYIR